MHVRIRRARLEDAALLPDVERSAGETFRSLPDLAWVADADPMATDALRVFIGTGAAWVAEEEGAGIIGFLVGEPVKGALHIWQIAVHHDRQGLGIGTRLIEAAADHARGHGRDLTLTTFRDVAWNGAYYARRGFVTLEGEAVGDHLRTVLDYEATLGLPMERRCAMRRRLT